MAVGLSGTKILTKDDMAEIMGPGSPTIGFEPEEVRGDPGPTPPESSATESPAEERRTESFPLVMERIMTGKMGSQLIPAMKRQRSIAHPPSHYRDQTLGIILLPPKDPVLLMGFVDTEPHLRACCDVKADDASRGDSLIIPSFASKCLYCGEEFDRELPQCSECGGEVRPPDKTQRKFLERVMRNPNPVQSWKDIRKSCMWFLEEGDEVWLEVQLKSDGDPQFWPASPETMRFIKPEVKKTICPVCGTDQMTPSGYCIEHYSTQGRRVKYADLEYAYGTEINAYFTGGQIIHYNRYGTRYYGDPPTWSARTHVRAMLESIMFNADAFEGREVPNIMVGLEGASDIEVQRVIAEWKAAVHANEHFAGVTNTKVSKADIYPSNRDMQWQQLFVRMRNTLMAIMKTPLMKLGISETGGAGMIVGWQLIGAYWDTVEDGMEQFDEAVNRYFLKYHGITDWRLESQTSRPFDTEKVHTDERADIQSGIKSINEVRVDRGLDPVSLESGEPDPVFEKPTSPAFSPGLGTEEQVEGGPTPPVSSQSVRAMPPRKAPAGKKTPGVATTEAEMSAELRAELNRIVSRIEKGNMSKREIDSFVSAELAKLSTNLEQVSNQRLKDAYIEGVNHALSDTDLEFKFGGTDQAVLDSLAADPTGSIHALRTFDTAITDQFNDIIRESFVEGETTKEVVRRMREVVNTEVYKLERIARTETTRISNNAKDRAYELRETERGEVFRFEWVGPTDARTTDICIWIKKEVDKVGKGKGVTRTEMKGIQEEAIRKFGSTGSYLLPHINCRHTQVRAIT